MTSLVLLEFDASGIKQPSRSAVAAAAGLGEVHVLVAGVDLGAATAAAAKLPGVAKVLVADNPALDHLLAEPASALLVALAPAYSHMLAATTAVGKNVMPRVAALLGAEAARAISGHADRPACAMPKPQVGFSAFSPRSNSAISRARSDRSNSPSVTGEPPNVLVSTMSAPAAK